MVIKHLHAFVAFFAMERMSASICAAQSAYILPLGVFYIRLLHYCFTMLLMYRICRVNYTHPQPYEKNKPKYAGINRTIHDPLYLLLDEAYHDEEVNCNQKIKNG